MVALLVLAQLLIVLGALTAYADLRRLRKMYESKFLSISKKEELHASITIDRVLLIVFGVIAAVMSIFYFV